ncbi:MAG TPA: TMEM175 family protein [Candidatus Acidoferrales bacterium]|nr:TMEM175 family protein [Candidatus Acidoferrales bacterium]
MNKARFEAFSDSVYAFAITLLILGLALPAFKNSPPSDRELAHALLHLWPNLLAYVLSFAVIGIMWQNHRAIFRLVEKIDVSLVAPAVSFALYLLVAGYFLFPRGADADLAAKRTQR